MVPETNPDTWYILFLDSSKPKKNIVFHPHLTEVL